MAAVQALQCFHLFPQLPGELRAKIWSAACQEPRTVRIRYRMEKIPRRNGVMVSSFAGWRSVNPVPSVLQTSVESRTEAQKYYALAFATDDFPSNCYFNYTSDTLYFEMVQDMDYMVDSFIGWAFVHDDKKIERVKVDIDQQLYSRRTFCWNELRMLVNIKFLTLVIQAADHEQERDWHMAHIRKTAEDLLASHLDPKWIVPEITVLSGATGENWGTIIIEEKEEE